MVQNPEGLTKEEAFQQLMKPYQDQAKLEKANRKVVPASEFKSALRRKALKNLSKKPPKLDE
jgi:hypothetical protein